MAGRGSFHRNAIRDIDDVRIKFSFSIALLALTLAGTAALADPPPKKKPTYPPPEQSNTVGSLGQPHRDPNGPAQPREPTAPVAAPEVPKVEAEPPMPSSAPLSYSVQPDAGSATQAAGPGGTMMAPMMRAPMGPPPTGFLPDHPFISGIVAGLIGSDLGSKLYGGPMMGDQSGVLVGYVGRVLAILFVAWMIFRLISRKASGINEPGLAPPGRREPSFGRSPDAGGARREPSFRRPER
jgi:hypothetical protein